MGNREGKRRAQKKKERGGTKKKRLGNGVAKRCLNITMDLARGGGRKAHQQMGKGSVRRGRKETSTKKSNGTEETGSPQGGGLFRKLFLGGAQELRGGREPDQKKG